MEVEFRFYLMGKGDRLTGDFYSFKRECAFPPHTGDLIEGKELKKVETASMRFGNNGICCLWYGYNPHAIINAEHWTYHPKKPKPKEELPYKEYVQ